MDEPILSDDDKEKLSQGNCPECEEENVVVDTYSGASDASKICVECHTVFLEGPEGEVESF